MRHWKIGILLVVLVVGAFAMVATSAPGKPGKKVASASWGVHAVMTGKREVSPTGKKRAGDLDGFGVFAATVKGDQFCYGITVAGIATPIASHVHFAKRGKNGAIVIPLTPPSSGDPGASSACVTVDTNLLAAIRKHPNRYYANVHTGDFPGGAIRGQLRKAQGS
jgi:CHRD domain